MGETSKRASARRAEGFFERYLVGKGIDIGCGNDPVTPDCAQWDLMNGDAQYMVSREGNGPMAETYDWVYSSHCLEHVHDPVVALQSWWRILKPGGYLIVMVPDEDLYEQGCWPSRLNTDHKTTWTIAKGETWSPVSHNLAQELGQLKNGKIESLRLIDTNYDYKLNRGIEGHFVLSNELATKIKDKKTLEPTDFDEALKLLGFWLIDQSGNGDVEMSIEGIVRKLA